MNRRVVLVLIVGGVWSSHPAPGQGTPGPARPTPQASAIPPEVVDAARSPLPPGRSKPDEPARTAEAKRPDSRLSPLPRQVSAKKSATGSAAARNTLSEEGRFANPGGVGRYAEYYTPNTLNSPSALRSIGGGAARFGGGGVPTRSGQIAAFQAGQARARNIQNNINAYSRPNVVYGIGLGYGGFGLGGGGLYGGGFR